jgi:hypothetical protein
MYRTTEKYPKTVTRTSSNLYSRQERYCAVKISSNTLSERQWEINSCLAAVPLFRVLINIYLNNLMKKMKFIKKCNEYK